MTRLAPGFRHAALLALSVSPLASAHAQTVAVIDTGVDLTHTEFSGRVPAGACFGTSAVCPAAARTGDDDHGHGSHVAGIIAGAADGRGVTGVAPRARILPVKVLSASGSGDLASVAAGIDFAKRQGARVINMSLGGSGGSSTLLAALRNAKSQSVLVAAAGNQGNSFRPLWPAAYATDGGIVGSMLIVGSVGATNTISRFSNTPGTAGCVASGGRTSCFKDFFVVAPGENILSAYYTGGYARMSGTSMAAPFVAGTAALVLERSPFLTPAQVVDIIKRSATDLGARGVDGVYGWGLVNPVKALQPLGRTRVATAGASAAAFAGTGEIAAASYSGPLGAALARSSALGQAVAFDAYGRDFATDLAAGFAAGAARSGYRLDALLQSGQSGWDAEVHQTQSAYMQAAVDPGEVNAVRALDPGTDQDGAISDLFVAAQIAPGALFLSGHETRLAGRFSAADLSAQDGGGAALSAQALNAPYLSLTDGGGFAALQLETAPGLTLSFGQAWTSAADAAATPALAEEAFGAERTPGRSARATLVGATFAPDDTWLFGVTISATEEAHSLLGSVEAGALALTGESRTLAVGLSARAALGDGWSALASYAFGRSEADPAAGGVLQAIGPVSSAAYGVALTKLGVFDGDDGFVLAVSRPLHVTAGEAIVTVSTGVTDDRAIVYATERLDLRPEAPETQFEAGYAMSFGAASSLGVSALYQADAGGVAGADAATLLLRYRTEF